jgi:hypothetical protein
MKLDRAIVGQLVGAVCAVSLAACGGGGSGGSSPMVQMTTGLTDTALVSDGIIAAAHTDTNLQNAWGVAFAPNGLLWIADNNSNKSTIYDGTGAPQPLVVSIAAGINGPANPTGQVYNGTADVVITTGNRSGQTQFALGRQPETIAIQRATRVGTSVI